MTTLEGLFNWCRTCPELSRLWALHAEITDYTDVIRSNSTAPLYSDVTQRFVDGKARISGIPTEDYHETYTLQCFRGYFASQDDYNLNVYEEVENICKWFIEQQNALELPEIAGEQINFIELLTPIPLVQWEDNENKIVAYYVSIRLHKTNPAKRVDYTI